MNRNIIKRLVIPLLILITASCILHSVIDNDSFFINLATELIGIIITIVYVDWIIKLNDKQQWEEAEKRISSRIRLFINASITNTRVSLGFDTDIFDYAKINSSDINVINSELIRITKEILEPTTKVRINAFEQGDWRLFSQNVNSIGQEAEKMLTIFGEKLSPKQYALLIDIQDLVRNTLAHYLIFPDIAGVPDELLPQTRTPAPVLKQVINHNTSKGLRELLVKVRELSETLSGND